MSSRLYNLLHCTICTEKYNETDRRPKVLCCGHTFCMKCLQEVFSRSLYLPVQEHIPTLRCPSCRQTTEIFNVWCVSHLSDNFSIVNFLTEEKSSKQYCRNHQHDMTIFCYQCQRLLCPSCALQHAAQTRHKTESAESAALKYRQQIHLAINDCKKKQNRLLEIIQEAEVEKLKLESLSRSLENIAIATNDFEMLFQEQILKDGQKMIASLSQAVKQEVSTGHRSCRDRQTLLSPPGYWCSPNSTEVSSFVYSNR
ncbi:E3 ubiquitin-protein ligase TRIM32-like [Phyllobates terribilis]|uniref:E3 ubiquitin-protein ligase TRIM32-like n=1 Tax=Phyllobates terribilis TaxID=111132 RepID=UPI003CCAE42A